MRIDAVLPSDFSHQTVRGRVVHLAGGIGEARDEVVVQEVARGVADAEDADEVVVARPMQAEVVAQQVARVLLILTLLLAPPLELLVVGPGLVDSRVAAVGQRLARLRDVHVVQPVRLHGRVVEPGAVAALPLGAADHAELGRAAARHVVAPFLQLHRRRAVVASLPPVLLRHFREPPRRLVLGALPRLVPAPVARRAHLRLAARTRAELAPSTCSARVVRADVFGLDPGAAVASRAIDAVFGGIFLKLPVPFHFEFQIEELLHKSEWDAVFVAALRGHMRRIVDRQCEDAPKAAVAHVVAAGEFWSS